MIEKIKSIVKEAGKLILNAEHIQEHVTSKEGSSNYVTKYDVEVQKFLYSELAKVCPEALFIGEEDEKQGKLGEGYCFIIDPIDGTTNFIFDHKHSAISVALMYRNEIILGVVYNPYLNEIFYAEKGKGAFLDDRYLKIADLDLSEGVVCFGTAPYYREKADETFQMARLLYDRAIDLRRSGSAALDICYVAANRYVLFYEMKLSPWDYAAASCILKEAGGRISTMQGKEITFQDSCSILAATPATYADYYKLIE